MKTIVLANILLLTFGWSIQGAVLTGPVYNPTTGHNYFLLGQSTWLAAEAEALSLGGHLATINDAAENIWVTTTFINYAGQEKSLWIGLNDQAQEGTFVWASGETALFRNWEAGQPDNGGGIFPEEDFVHIWPASRNLGAWNDYNTENNWFGMPFHGVVEVVPEPTALSLIVLGVMAVSFLRRNKAVA